MSFLLLAPVTLLTEGIKFTPSAMRAIGIANTSEVIKKTLLAGLCFHAYQQVSRHTVHQDQTPSEGVPCWSLHACAPASQRFACISSQSLVCVSVCSSGFAIAAVHRSCFCMCRQVGSDCQQAYVFFHSQGVPLVFVHPASLCWSTGPTLCTCPGRQLGSKEFSCSRTGLIFLLS